MCKELRRSETLGMYKMATGSLKDDVSGVKSVWDSQSGDVWHLYGFFAAATTLLRTCRLKLQQNIFFCHILTDTKWAVTWQNQQSDCAPSEDSDQARHSPSLIRVFAVR